jgi:Golgi phosphoprotein 3 (GPP34)
MTTRERPDTLPATLYLLSYRPERGKFGRTSDLEYLLRAAVLVDLTLRGHLKDDQGRPVPTSKVRTGDKVLDAGLREIREASPKSWNGWIRRHGRSVTIAVQDQLVSARVIAVEERRVLGFLPSRKVTLRSPEAAEEAREQAHAALHDDTDPARVDRSAAALVALAAAGQLTAAVSAKDRRAHAARISALGARCGQGVPALTRVIKQARMARAAAYSGGG